MRNGHDLDWDKQCDALRQKIAATLAAPPDPETAAKLEMIRRRQEEVKDLSQKPVAAILPSEALRVIWERQLEYYRAPGHYERWWEGVDSKVQQKINVAAETFTDFNAYSRRMLSAGAVVLNSPYHESAYRLFVESLPTITEQTYWNLIAVSATNVTTISRGRRQPTVKVEIDRFLTELRTALNRAFGISQGRPRTETNRDRQLSEWRYAGYTLLACAREWNKSRQLKRVESITPSLVKKAVDRYRVERAPLMWALRVWIYQSNFPLVR